MTDSFSSIIWEMSGTHNALSLRMPERSEWSCGMPESDTMTSATLPHHTPRSTPMDSMRDGEKIWNSKSTKALRWRPTASRKSNWALLTDTPSTLGEVNSICSCRRISRSVNA